MAPDIRWGFCPGCRCPVVLAEKDGRPNFLPFPPNPWPILMQIMGEYRQSSKLWDDFEQFLKIVNPSYFDQGYQAGLADCPIDPTQNPKE